MPEDVDAGREPKLDSLDVAILAVIACVLAYLVYRVRTILPDDAFIYLRISNNIASGHGWAFNDGSAVNAATSPIFAIVVATLCFLRLPDIWPLLVASFLGLFTLAFVLYCEARSFGRMPALVLCLAVCTWPSLLITVGLEPSVFLACIALTAMATQKRNYVLAGFFAGLTALGRPEGLAMLPLLLAAELVRTRKIAWKALASFAVVVVPWAAFSLVRFGTVLPHTMKVKAAQASTGYWSDPWYRAFLWQLIAPRGFFVLLALAGAWYAVRNFSRRPFAFLVTAFATVQVAGYSLLKAPSSYFWYYAVGDMAYSFAAVLGLIVLAQGCARRFARSRAAILNVAAILIAVFCARQEWRGMSKHLAPFRLSSEYRSAGQWLKEHGAAGDWVACNEIGYLGYYSGLNVRDMLGLLEPSSIQPLKQHQWDWWFTGFSHPRFVVLHVPGWIGEPDTTEFAWDPAAEQQFDSSYRQVFASGTIRVLERQ